MTDTLRIALAGVHRGGSFFKAFQTHPATRLVALCDLDEATLAEAGKAGGVDRLYTTYERMLDEARPDAVVVATPMPFHVLQSIAALQRGIHVLSEVTAAVSLDEARWLVQACKASPAVYMLAENCNYMKPYALVSAMVDAGCFGEVYYAEGEYLHNVRHLFLGAEGRPTWRYYWQAGINGLTYGTHSLGPCLRWIKERLARVSCIGSGRWVDGRLPRDDTVVMLGKTEGGRLVRVRQDLTSWRPYGLNYALQGTRGAYESSRQAGGQHWVWLEGRCKEGQWLPLETFEAEFLPEAWSNPPAEALVAGHWGADYFTAMEFVDAIRSLRPPAIGIHEALDLTLPGLVSQESIRRGGEWLEVPDSRLW